MATSVGQIGLDLVVNQNRFQSQMRGIESLAKKAGATLAAAFGVKKLIDFGKSCLELGSDLAEVQNVVDVTFPNMTAQVDKFAKSAAQSFGLSETMAKQFTGTFGAMAKAFGFSEEQAYNMAPALPSWQVMWRLSIICHRMKHTPSWKIRFIRQNRESFERSWHSHDSDMPLTVMRWPNGFGKTTAKMSKLKRLR